MSDRHSRKRQLGAALALTAVFFAVEVVGGMLSGSLALLADAAHMMTDLGALVMSYAAMTLAERRPTRKHTFGLHRAEILAAFVNAEVLLLVSIGIFYEAYRRFSEPPAIETALMLGVAIAGLIANLIAMRFLHGGHQESLNMKAAYLEVLTDMLGSIAVVVGAVLIHFTGRYWIDPVLSVGIAAIMVPRTVNLLRESVHILLEGSPTDIDLPQLREQLRRIEGVEEIHDLHLWTLTSGVHSASVHIRAVHDSPRGEVLQAVQRWLRDEAGVEHATVQVEWGPGAKCETTEHEF